MMKRNIPNRQRCNKPALRENCALSNAAHHEAPQASTSRMKKNTTSQLPMKHQLPIRRPRRSDEAKQSKKYEYKGILKIPVEWKNSHRPTEASSYRMQKNGTQRLPVSHLPMREQKQYYYIKYKQCKRGGKIRIFSIETYQGRKSESTNGCTVISALVVANHLQDPEPFTTISTATIQDVIDNQCGPILRNIRKKLGLSGSAYISPSEVHEQILLQHRFQDVTGGNIMNHEHVRSFLQALSASNGKAGATLFFQEHVVSIVKSINPVTRKPYYDFIDSLPVQNKHGHLTPGTRTRCCNLDALENVIMCYAIWKLRAVAKYNLWDDQNAESDPRVFQGFVWTAASTDNNENENSNDVVYLSNDDDDEEEEVENENKQEEEHQKQAAEVVRIQGLSIANDIKHDREQHQEAPSSNDNDDNDTFTPPDSDSIDSKEDKQEKDQVLLLPAPDSMDNKNNEEAEEEDKKDQETPTTAPPLPQIRRSRRLASVVTPQEVPLPPLLRRSPRLALMPRVSYVGMC
jgi:hypothetical protein